MKQKKLSFTKYLLQNILNYAFKGGKSVKCVCS